MRAGARRAGRPVVPPAAPVGPGPDGPAARPPTGDEPDRVLAAHAAAAGSPALLAGWAAPLPDGGFAWALRLVAAPAPDESVPETRASDTRASVTRASDTPASDTPASDTPASDTPASDTPASDTRSSDDRDPIPPRPGDGPPAFRTVDRAGGLAPDRRALARDLADAAARLLAGPPAPAPRGLRTVGDLARRLRARSGLFDACLAERTLAVPELLGLAVVEVSVGPRGDVRDVRLTGSSFGDPGLEACLADAAAQVDFPAGVGGTSRLEQRVAWPRPTAPVPD